MSNVVAIIFAGGRGERMGSTVPKQFLELDGKPVLAWTLELCQHHPRVDKIRVVAEKTNFPRVEEICKRYSISKLAGISEGGATAQDSIYSGLVASRDANDGDDAIVLLHDGVRPWVDAGVITANIEAALESGSAVKYTPCYETILVSRDGKHIDSMPRRRESYTAQAPQTFRLGAILAAHEQIRKRPEGYEDMVDQATICNELGIPVRLVKGNRGNVKITTQEDIIFLEALIKTRRLGNGT